MFAKAGGIIVMMPQMSYIYEKTLNIRIPKSRRTHLIRITKSL
jgi:hypothetical protein